MKKRNLLILLAIAACVAVYLGYRALDMFRTDNTAPRITFSDETPDFSVLDPREALLRGVTAVDDRDGDVSASVVVERVKLTDPDGSILVKYAAFDRSGNVVKAEREARYTDYESPRFSLSRSLLFEAQSDFDLMDIIGASDPLDGNIRHRIRVTPLDDSAVTARGEHDVEFRVTNTLGETVRLTLPVGVYAEGVHTLDVELTNYLIYLDAGSSFHADRYLESVTWNRETIPLSDGMPEGYSLQVEGDVDPNTPGVYAVDYTVKQTNINERNPEDSLIRTGCARLIVVVEG